MNRKFMSVDDHIEDTHNNWIHNYPEDVGDTIYKFAKYYHKDDNNTNIIFVNFGFTMWKLLLTDSNHTHR